VIKTVENALQVNILTICKAARASGCGIVKMEWRRGSSLLVGVAVLTDDAIALWVGGRVFQTSITQREFRKDRFLSYIHCLACAKRCHILYLENGSLQCRKCAGLTYECQRGHDRERMTVKVQKAMNRLGANGRANPPRRAGVWRKTYYRRLGDLADAMQELARTIVAGKG